MRYMLVDFLKPFRFITTMQKQMWMLQSNILDNAEAFIGCKYCLTWLLQFVRVIYYYSLA
jgi:hypothetical protein